MIRTRTCINVWSDLNNWIDFVFVFGAYTDIPKAEEVISQAYDDYFGKDQDCYDTLADYICNRLDENDIMDYEIYFKNDEDDM